MPKKRNTPAPNASSPIPFLKQELLKSPTRKSSSLSRRGMDYLADGQAGSAEQVTYRADDGQLKTVSYKDISRWSREAKQGRPDAQYNLGVLYFKGIGMDRDNREALKWFRKAAEQGYPHGQGFLGLMYENGWGVSQDYEQSVKWYKEAAEHGN
ncbi:MAG: tetratricopeptide repeat protein, partial [Nitrospinales bacterium]